MKKLMITAASAALIFGAAACSDTSDTTSVEADTSTYAENDADMTEEEVVVTAPVEVVYLTSGQMALKDMIGAKVTDDTGETVASIDDMIIGDDGTIESVVFTSGDFIDDMTQQVALPFSDLALMMDEDNEPYLNVSMTDEQLATTMTMFEADGMNDYRLASEIIGASADFNGDEGSATINDLIFTDDGTVEFAIATNGLVGSVGGDARILPYDLVVIENGNEDVVINATEEQFNTMDKFEYDREDAMEEMDDTTTTMDQ